MAFLQVDGAHRGLVKLMEGGVANPVSDFYQLMRSGYTNAIERSELPWLVAK